MSGQDLLTGDGAWHSMAQGLKEPPTSLELGAYEATPSKINMEPEKKHWIVKETSLPVWSMPSPAPVSSPRHPVAHGFQGFGH